MQACGAAKRLHIADVIAQRLQHCLEKTRYLHLSHALPLSNLLLSELLTEPHTQEAAVAV